MTRVTDRSAIASIAQGIEATSPGRLLGGAYRPQSTPDAKPPLWFADA